jgi:hypothetical protein
MESLCAQLTLPVSEEQQCHSDRVRQLQAIRPKIQCEAFDYLQS